MGEANKSLDTPKEPIIHSQIFLFILITIIGFQVFLYTFITVIWFQVLLSNTYNFYMISSISI